MPVLWYPRQVAIRELERKVCPRCPIGLRGLGFGDEQLVECVSRRDPIEFRLDHIGDVVRIEQASVSGLSPQFQLEDRLGELDSGGLVGGCGLCPAQRRMVDSEISRCGEKSAVGVDVNESDTGVWTYRKPRKRNCLRNMLLKDEPKPLRLLDVLDLTAELLTQSRIAYLTD
jgi:hypothetical protein